VCSNPDEDPKPDPVTRQTREEDPVLPLRVLVAFPAESVAFSGGFSD
jgi:hypothetical protein